MTRQEFFAKAKLERWQWAKKVDPAAVAKFEAAARARRGYGVRVPK